MAEDPAGEYPTRSGGQPSAPALAPGAGVATEQTPRHLTVPAVVALVATGAAALAAGCGLLAALTAPPKPFVVVLWVASGLSVLVGTALVVRVVLPGALRWDWLVAVTVVEAVVAGLVVLFVKAPDLYPLAVGGDPATQAARETARASSITGLRTATLAGLAGLAAVGGLLVNAVNSRLSARTLELSRESQDLTRQGQERAQAQAERTAQATQASLELTAQGQLTDRYAKAIELLGSDNLTVRLGGVYALSQIATDTTRAGDQTVVVEVLSALVRRQLHVTLHSNGHALEHDAAASEDDGREPSADLLAAISVLAQLPERRGVAFRADFTGLDFHGIRLSNARLRGANLNGVRLVNAQLEEADFYRAELTAADLTGARLTEADFTAADLFGIQLSTAHLASAELRGAKLGEANLEGAVLTRARLRHANLVGAVLRSALLEGAAFGDADLTGADLARANLTDADLTDADLTGVDLTGAELVRAKLGRATLRGANLSDANLSRADVSGARLTDAYLPGADLTGAKLLDAGLRMASLRGADLSGADLTDADLTDADLSGADLSGANLSGANFAGAKLAGWTLAVGASGDAPACEGLTFEQLASARGDRRTALPTGLMRPDNWEAS